LANGLAIHIRISYVPKNQAKRATLTVNFVANARPLIIGVVNTTKIYSLAMFELRHQYTSICKDAAFSCNFLFKWVLIF